MALSIDIEDMLAAVREIRTELDGVKAARRRLPADDYLGRALLLVEQQNLEERLAEVRRAARGS